MRSNPESFASWNLSSMDKLLGSMLYSTAEAIGRRFDPGCASAASGTEDKRNVRRCIAMFYQSTTFRGALNPL
jgi:hypothetical protein